MTDAPQTAEGWYVLHDFRSVDWRAWRAASEDAREAAVAEGVDYLRRHEAVEDAGDGDSAVFAVLGHKADLLLLHFRPTMDDLDLAERRFERTALAEFTERADSYVSVTEVSGYVSQDFFDGGDVEDTGLSRYIQGKLQPSIPEDVYVSFYPMAKRRGAEYNWYDLPFEERADLMAGHGEVGRKFGGTVRQVIASSVGLDDWEWGVTLFSDDPAELKNIVYEMRFDDATSKYGEFGRFFVGRRFEPEALGAYLAGEKLDVPADRPPVDQAGRPAVATGGGGADADGPATGATEVREELADLDVYAGKPHGEDVYALVLYSAADPDELAAEVDGLRANFDHYDSHVKTAVYENAAGSGDEPDAAGTGADDGRTAVVSIWETQQAADTASGFLADLPGVVGRAEAAEDGFSTLGMFYTVRPEHREAFLAKFETVAGLLDGMDGHRRTGLLANREDENDMFIASRWDDREDAMAFFRSEEFASTVDWGRDVLADRPRHVFLA